MNSALKPALGGAGVPASGQSSPAKGNVAGVNHAAVLPQGANSHHNSLVGQNLSQHAPPPHAPPHAVPSMAPVSANMAQMAQNMSHHGNLSHLNQNSAPANITAAPSPSKVPSTSSPLSLVQDKVVVNASQPLALTRTPEKKESDSTGHANGTIDSAKPAGNAPAALKPQNPEPNKDKQDIAKTSPSTPKPPEKPNVPTTIQKPEGVTPASVSQAEGPALPKVATANEPTEKSPSKPVEPTPAPMADVAPPQSDSKPVPESANNQLTSQVSTQPASQPAIQPVSQPEKVPAPVKQDPPVVETVKPEAPKVEEKKVEAPEKPPITEEKKEEVKEKVEPPKKEDQVDSKPLPPKVEESSKVEVKKEAKKPETRPKSTLKLATVTPPMRKRRHVSPAKISDGLSPAKKAADGDGTPSSDSKSKRNRTKVQLYQSPTPELAMATKLSASAGRSTPTKPNDDKLIVFYKNEYLAVRNAEGGFYVCQAIQNVYRTTRKIKIRWLSQDKSDPKGETYKPDFYDTTDMECVLTTLSLTRGGGGAQILSKAESARASSILERALRAEQGSAGSLDLTPEHPDGLDLSLYKDESQLDKKSRKRSARQSPQKPSPNATPQKEAASPAKKARMTPKRSPKSARLSKTPAKPIPTNNNKRKSPGSTPVVASTSKTATAVTEKAKPPAAKVTPKRSPALAKKVDTPIPAATPTRGRRAAKDTKPSPIVATPSTSTGKATRTPRKPPSRK